MKNTQRRDTVEGTFGLIFTIILIVLLTIQVFLRYAFGKSIAWVEEVSRYSFVWAVYCFIILAAKEGRHCVSLFSS